MTALFARRPATLGRTVLADATLACGLAVIAMLFTDDAAVAQGFPVPGIGGYVLIGCAAASLVLRRIRPVPAFVACLVCTTGYFVAGYPLGPGVYPLLVATYTVASRLSLRSAAVLCGAALASAVTVLLLARLFLPSPAGESALLVVSWAGWLVLPWALGALVRLRRDQTARDAADRLRARDEDLQRHATGERLRVARDLHDSVGHNLAVIAMQAGVALHILEHRPEQVRQALEAIRSQSKEGLGSLRSALDVFRGLEQPEPDEPPTPQSRTPAPGLERLDTLLQHPRLAGLDVSVNVVGEPVALPAAIDQAGYRILQESLTNVLRHAASDQVAIEVRYTSGALTLTVVDGSPTRVLAASTGGPGHPEVRPGHGLIGMRERAMAVGGWLSAEFVPTGFKVTAHLPYDAGTR